MNKFLVIMLFLVKAVTAQTEMTSAEAQALRTLVKEKAALTKTILSDFTQYKHLDFLSNDIESNGKLAFQAPDKVLWQYSAPFSYSILFKNEKLYINDNGNKSDLNVGSNKLFKQLNQLITASINGDMFISDEFEIDYFKTDDSNIVHFTPKDAQFAEFIKTFHISFSKTGEVTRVKMIEPSNDYTLIIFYNRIENKAIPDAVFSQ
ncbi:LolA family protein [Maribacter thermophilus]|uniref:LolA family protein n=1 Tax=Maribacter thermophilus TaxID=1197874 RepID=UPI0006414460|nr:outer membrane lipoprotein carrier protein LolA [Maribacter thermophilus]